MPSIYDTILREDPMEVARREATARLEKQRQLQQSRFLASLEGLPAGVRQGAVTGEAAFRLFDAIRNRDADAQEIEQSPEVARAKSDADLVKSLQGLEADPASAEWATQAAAQAKARGREDIALQLLGEAAQRRKAEAKLSRETKEKEDADWRATVNTLPSAQKYSLYVNDPETVTARFGLKGKAAENFIKDAQDNLETLRLKNAAELNKVKPAKLGNVDKGDLADIDSVMAARGYDADAFDRNLVGDGTEQRDAFARLVAGHAQEYRQAQARLGRQISLPAATEDTLTYLEEQGFFTKSDPNVFGFGGGIDLAEDFSGTKFNNALQQRIDELQGAKPVTTAPTVAAEAAPSGPEVPFVDFTQPPR